jgi:diguanylate cyclase (GGDEF)-like protein/PAS domain S-box-containing protein
MHVRRDSQIGDSAERDSGSVPNESALLLECEDELDFHATLLDAISDGILAHTLDGHIIYVNDAACAIYGYCRDDFERLGPWGWVSEDAHQLIQTRIAEIRKPGGIVFPAFGPPHEDGSPMHTEVHAQLCDTLRHGQIAVSVVHDVTDRVVAEEKIRHLAFHDTLTGLPNRVLLQERMRLALASADRHGDIVGVVYIDLDDFKPVNDRLGHAIGDEVLVIIAERLRSCTRDEDTVARMGGDEFIALLPRLESSHDLAAIAASIANCIDSPIPVCGDRVTVTASVGLALYLHGEATDELITRADHAMYRAKQDGVSGWEEYLAEQLEARR